MNKVVKRILITLLCLLLVLVLVVGGYVLYIVLQYSRIEDHAPLEVVNQQPHLLKVDSEYTALTYNIGFGAYDHDFSFFMDSGRMLDGTEVSGKHARAQSRVIVQSNTDGAVKTALASDPDFVLMQEVDQEADRSWGVHQDAVVKAAFPQHASVFASNFHSAYLFYPLHEPHGAVQAGLLSLSRYEVAGAERRSFPVDNGFPTRFFDLDRCFSVLRIPVEGSGELVLINTHMSAYDEGGLIRAAQLSMLGGVLAEEREKGNWVVVGGDFNHALCDTVEAFDSQQQVPDWVSVFSEEEDLPAGFSVVRADNVTEVATCRSTDLPYQKGVNYSAVLDGFIVSDNVEASALNIDAGFEYSDHNPVQLTFTLLR